MSGIVGILRCDRQPVNRRLFGKMMDVLKHRGPDGSGDWVNGGLALGHQKLNTTPESIKEIFPLVSREPPL